MDFYPPRRQIPFNRIVAPLAVGFTLCLLMPGISCRPAEDRLHGSQIVRHFVIYEALGEYCAWPDISRTAGGDLIVLFCGSEEHLGPDGKILLSRSTNNGATWEWPVTIFDTPIDERESGITRLADGRILGHFWSTFHTPESYAALPPLSYEKAVIDRWIRIVASQDYVGAAENQGGWIRISSDAGRTWSAPTPGPDAIHGGIQLKDGSLLVASYRSERNTIGVYTTPAPEARWQRTADILSPQPDSLAFGEPHVLQLPSGRIIMMIRATARPYNDMDPRCCLWESYSDDSGKTWTAPFATPLWGFPPHLLLLSDGRVVCSYGYRRPPFGQRACISADGVLWKLENEVILRDDAPNGDLGYPASLELEPGLVLTVYYQPNVPAGTQQRMKPPDPHRNKPGILGTIWKVNPR
jgi:sialidase-1